MNKIIRWPGLLAFVVIVGLIVGGTYLFANSLIKSVIESQGSSAVGAKVDVGKVELSLSPAGIVIYQLDVTDAEQPMQNVVSIKTIRAQFDLLKAFMGQLVINEASVNGMQFATARKVSGALAKKPKKEKVPKEPSFIETQFNALMGELPDSKELLAREPLLVDERQKALEASLEAKDAAWEATKAKLPSDEKFKQYQARTKEISNRKIQSIEDFQKTQAELKQLQQDIKADKEVLEQAKTQLKNSFSELSAELKALKDAPKEDRDRLLGKYSLDEGGLVNMTGLLFGDSIQGYVETALYWYERIAPYLASDDDAEKEAKKVRAEGRFVHFKEANPTPDFIIEKMAASAILPMGELSATARNITHQQYVRNQPTTLHVGSEVLRNVKRLDVDAVFDYRKKKQGVSRANFTVQQFVLEDYAISKQASFPLALSKARSDMQGEVSFQNGRLSAALHADFLDAAFQTAAGKGFSALIAQAFASIHQFDLDVRVAGTLKKPDISVSSNIDKQLKASIESQVKAQLAQFKAQLEAELNTRLDQYLQKINIQGFADDQNSLEDKINGLDELLKAKLDDFKEQKKEEAKDKAKDAVKDKLKGFLK